MKKVLVLEDEDNIRSFVVINLKRAGNDKIGIKMLLSHIHI